MTYKDFWHPLTQVYDIGEAKAIARLVMDIRFGLSMTDLLCGKTADETEATTILQRLLTGEPVQYVLGETEFGGRTLYVEPGVLIPRPETYELCQWCISLAPAIRKGHILDIGTGSGCIACTLAQEMPQAEVTAWDISDEALRIARENAKRTNVHVSFEKQDALHPPVDHDRWDLIVSNPPYICEKEQATMERNVLEHEPRLALFVPDNDPLLFYSHIARYATTALKPDGRLLFEINPLYVGQIEEMLREYGLHDIEIRNDQFGKQRFISVCKQTRK